MYIYIYSTWKLGCSLTFFFPFIISVIVKIGASLPDFEEIGRIVEELSLKHTGHLRAKWPFDKASFFR